MPSEDQIVSLLSRQEATAWASATSTDQPNDATCSNTQQHNRLQTPVLVSTVAQQLLSICQLHLSTVRDPAPSRLSQVQEVWDVVPHPVGVLRRPPGRAARRRAVAVAAGPVGRRSRGCHGLQRLPGGLQALVGKSQTSDKPRAWLAPQPSQLPTTEHRHTLPAAFNTGKGRGRRRE